MMIPDDARWLEGWYDRKPWREPEKFEKFGNHFQAVWYSDDPDNSTHAFMVEMSPEAFIITEYTHSEEYQYDLPDEYREPDHWKMRSVQFEPGEIYKIILETLREKAEESGTPACRVRPPRDPKVIAGYVMAIGNIYMSYHGGEEDTAESLP